jgi:hypothetical protein
VARYKLGLSIGFVAAVCTPDELDSLIHTSRSGLQSLFAEFDFCRRTPKDRNSRLPGSHRRFSDVVVQPLRLLPQPSLEHVTRGQALSNFLHWYMPVARDRSLDPDSYLLILPEVVSSSRVVQVACDVLAWSFLGELHEAHDLRLRAVQQYGQLLTGVRHILANTLRYKIQKDAVLAALLILARIETYMSFAKSSEDDGMKDARVHLIGAVTYFNMNSQEILRTRLGREMSSALCSFSRLNGFAQRRASILCPYPDLRNSVGLYHLADPNSLGKHRQNPASP